MKTAYENAKELLRQQKPALAYDGSELTAWQEKAREKLRELLGMEKFTRVSPDMEIEYETELEDTWETRFTFRTEAGYRVPAHLLLPKGVDNPPVMICLQGHSTGMHISLGRAKFEGDEKTIRGGDRDFCVRALKEGFAAVAMEQRSLGESRNPDSWGCQNSSMTNLIMGRTTIGERVWDVSRLIDVLKAEFADRMDTDCISLMGNSGGGTATAYAAALEPRLALAMPSCAMCAFTASIGAVAHCTCNYVPHIAEYFDMGDLMAMACPMPFVQVSGVHDTDFLFRGAQDVFAQGKRAYDGIGASDRCVFVRGEEGHRFYADQAWPWVHQLLKK